MLEIKQMLVSSAKYSIKAPYTMTPKFITIHNTANDAPAVNEANYHNNNNNQVSFHFAVDDKEIIQVVPTDRTAWHCGDGRGDGNMKSIGVEICYSKSGGARYDQAENNAVELTAYLLKKFNLPISAVKKHRDWSGKYCPHRILDRGTWNDFIKRVEKALDALNGESKASVPVARKEYFRIKSGTYNTKKEVENAKDMVVKNKFASEKYMTIHEDKGKFYFQTGTYNDEATAERYLQKMKNLKILWFGSVIKA